jgi:HPt (histidine-containing phosphotransfer) domain-containing protein
MLYDLSALRKLSDNDETFIIDMLQTFKKTAPPVFERMAVYLAEQKTEAIGREAHKLIPGVTFLGAKALQDVLVTLEEMAKQGDKIENIASAVKEATSMSQALIACFENDFPGKL